MHFFTDEAFFRSEGLATLGNNHATSFKVARRKYQSLLTLRYSHYGEQGTCENLAPFTRKGVERIFFPFGCKGSGGRAFSIPSPSHSILLFSPTRWGDERGRETCLTCACIGPSFLALAEGGRTPAVGKVSYKVAGVR